MYFGSSLLFFAFVFIAGCLCFNFTFYLVWVAFHISLAQDRPAFGTGKGNGAKTLLYTTILVIPFYFAGRSGIVGLGSRDMETLFSGLRETSTTSPVLLVFPYFIIYFYLFYFPLLYFNVKLVHLC